uniref:Protoheme IX farnesyltransferase n=1 Tax=Desulfovibrio sp. U5L TaxID=596152 RepID=I2Q5A8_9BACT
MQTYFLVTKPWIVFANLIAATAGFLLAARGRPDMALFPPALAGIALIVASGCVFNNCIDRDLDRKMARTRGRALSTRALSLPAGLLWASLLGITGTAVLWIWTNGLCLTVVSAGFAVYVGAYSLYLKRHSVHSTVIGSLAGAAPPLAAYCAVTGRLDLGAALVAAIFSLWQIPHSYAITIYRFDDYAAAGLPVLPVVAGIPATRHQIAGYILAFTLAAQALAFCGYAGFAYLLAATAIGLCWLALALGGGRTSGDRQWARKLYVCSMVAIVVLCAMMSLDAVPGPWGPPFFL